MDAFLPHDQEKFFVGSLLFTLFLVFQVEDTLSRLVVIIGLPILIRTILSDLQRTSNVLEQIGNIIARILLIPFLIHDIVVWLAQLAPTPTPTPTTANNPNLNPGPVPPIPRPAPPGHVHYQGEPRLHCDCLDGRVRELQRELLRLRATNLDLWDDVQHANAQVQAEIARRPRPIGFGLLREAQTRIAALELELARIRARAAGARMFT